MNEKNPNLKDKESIAEIIGTGAIIFGDLVHDRIHNILFDWDKILDFQGETSPYIQYTIVRIKSLIEKFDLNKEKINYEKLNSFEEKKLINKISQFKESIEAAQKSNKPHHIAKYALTLAQEFNSYYVKTKIQNEDLELQNSRLFLSFVIKTILEKSLALLGIKSPKEM